MLKDSIFYKIDALLKCNKTFHSHYTELMYNIYRILNHGQSQEKKKI